MDFFLNHKSINTYQGDTAKTKNSALDGPLNLSVPSNGEKDYKKIQKMQNVDDHKNF